MVESLRKDNHSRDSRDSRPKESFASDKTAPNNIQDVFLNSLRRDRTTVTVFLMGGVKLTGKIRSFDKYALVLETNSQEQLVFKHAISTVVVARATPTVSQSVQQSAEA
jgi:host factor-I protein